MDFETLEQFNEIKKKVDLLQQSVDRIIAYLGVGGQVQVIDITDRGPNG